MVLYNWETNPIVFENKLRIKIKYFTDIERIGKIDIGDWVDLRLAEDVGIYKGENRLLPLGIAMELPKGYEAHILPRSSTFKNWGILVANSMAIIDESYNGDNDQWFLNVFATRDTLINKGDRICQFRVMEKQPKIEFVEVETLGNKDRGGFGTTGVK